jgi:hypothetical protein
MTIAGMFAAAALSLSLTLASAPTGSQQADPAPPQPATALLPALGVALTAGGMAATYWTASEERDRNPDCARPSGGCYWVGVGGGLVGRVGAGLASYWGFTLGRAHAHRDLATGRTKSVLAYQVGGLVVGVGAVVTDAVASGLAMTGCRSGGSIDYACRSRKQYVPALISFGGQAALLLAGPTALYGFGYDNVAKHGRPRQAMLMPLPVDGGGGLALLSTF